MFEFLRDPNLFDVLALAPLCVAVVSLLVQIWLARLQRNGKKLTYKEGFESDIEGRSQAVVTIENTGSEPIVKSDYEVPITVFFEDQSARILQAEATLHTATAENRGLTATPRPQSVEIERTLLNPGDRLTVGALLTKSEVKVGVSAHIVGVSEIAQKAEIVERMKAAQNPIVYGTIAATLSFLVSRVFSFISELTSDEINDYLVVGVNLTIFVSGAISVILLIIGSLRWVNSAGDRGKIESSRNLIIGGILLLVLLFVLLLLFLTLS